MNISCHLKDLSEARTFDIIVETFSQKREAMRRVQDGNTISAIHIIFLSSLLSFTCI